MIELRPWTDDDRTLLARTVGDAAIMAHLGGAESPEKICSRHALFRDWSGDGGMMTIWIPTETLAVGTIGFWASTWAGDDVFEAGWMTLPQFGRRGIATEVAVSLRLSCRRQRRIQSRLRTCGLYEPRCLRYRISDRSRHARIRVARRSHLGLVESLRSGFEHELERFVASARKFPDVRAWLRTARRDLVLARSIVAYGGSHRSRISRGRRHDRRCPRT